MRLPVFLASVLLSLSPAAAQTFDPSVYWQCAAFARQFSGIGIVGDAWTWWGQAEGRYTRGTRPRVGAVMYFTPTARTRLGHVATVTAVGGERELTITHANWSPIGGTRGQIERDVLVRDVSHANDWSQVRVWYAPTGDLGTTAWPIGGFIYPQRARDVPRLTYARLDRLEMAAPRRALLPPLLGRDVFRLARLELSARND